MIFDGQRFFLMSMTFGAFVIGTATGSILTFGPGEPAAPTARLMVSENLMPSDHLAEALPSEVMIQADAGELAHAGPVDGGPIGRGSVRDGLVETVDLAATPDQIVPPSVSPALAADASNHAITATEDDAAIQPTPAEEDPALALTDPSGADGLSESMVSITEAALTPRPWRTEGYKAKPGDSFTTILKRAGVDNRQVHAALRSLKGVYDPRHLRVGQELAVTAAAQDNQPAQLLSVAFDLDFDHQLLITRDADGGFSTKKVEQAKHRELVHRGGNIQASLYLTAKRHAVPNSVTDRLIGMFSWDVDFQRDIHPGDSFETLYEEVSLERDKSQVKGELVYAGLRLRGKLIDAYRYSPEGVRANYYDSQGRSLRKFLLRTPIDGARLSSPFGKRRHPVLGYTKIHKGTDFAAPRGTPIYAGGSGVVERSDRYGTFGNYLRIRHNDTYSTAYAHLHKFAKGVRPGARVRQGQVVAYVGTTGRSTGPHLHYEVLKNGEQINPMSMKQPSATQLQGADLAAFKNEVAKIDAQRLRFAKQQRVASRTTGVSSPE